MIGARGVAGRRTNAAIFLGYQSFRIERLVGGIGPKLAPHAQMQPPELPHPRMP